MTPNPVQERTLRWERLADGSLRLLSDPNEVWEWLRFMILAHGRDAAKWGDWRIPLWEEKLNEKGKRKE